jgi:hypothetical protein
MDNDLPDDAVEMIRAIRTSHYEETKHMTVAERRAHDQQSIDEFDALLANAKPDYERFPFLAKR